MELLVIIVAVLIVISNASKNDKKKAQQKREHGFNDAFDLAEALASTVKAQQKQAVQPVQPVQRESVPAPNLQREPLVAQPLVQEIAQPQVHTHLAAECEEHDMPGSLGEGSMEGRDLCHEEQLLPPRTPRPAAPAAVEEAPGLQLDWSGENMVKAFVMQEVLTRPGQRRRHA